MKNATLRKPRPMHSNEMSRNVAPRPNDGPYDSDDESSLESLNLQINSNPTLAASPGVRQAQQNLNDQAQQNPSAFSQSGPVIDALSSGITVWTDPSSSAEQITSSSLKVASKVLYATSAIPGVDIVTAPLGFLVGLIGAIVGAFGSNRKSNYYNILQKLVDDAVNQLESEQVDQDLQGALNTMRVSYWEICDVLSQGPVPNDAPIISDLGTKDFLNAASYQVGEALENLRINLPYDKRDNWDNAAETYNLLATVLTFKVMYLMQGVSYFQLVDANTSDPGDRAQRLVDYTQALYARNSELGQASIYMVEPGITQAAITQAIYRLSDDKFRSIGALMAYYVDNPSAPDPKPWFWPTNATQYRFKVTDQSAPDYDGDMVRLATWSNRVGAHPRVLLGDQTFGDAKVAGYTGIESHWMLWADTDAYRPQPYYRWYLQTADSSSKARWIFMFQVFPTADEIAKYDIVDTKGRSLLIISSVDRDEVWHSSGADTNLHRGSFGDLINGPNANKYLWVLLSELE